MAIEWDPQVGVVGLQTLQEKLTSWQNKYRSGKYAINPNFTITTPENVTELTPEQAWFGLIAGEVILIEGAVALIWDQMSTSTAEGVGLDALLSLLELRRKAATATTVKIELTGQPLLPAPNQLVLHEGTQQLFKLPNQFAIPTTGAVQTILTSVENLAVQIDAGSSDFTPVNPANVGIFTITAIEDSRVGNPAENDDAYLLRKDRELGSISIATEPAIIAAVSRVQGISSLNGEFNRSPATSASGVPGWHMEIVVEGGADLDIANAIDIYRHGEEATFGDIVITAASGREVRFTRPSLVDVQVVYDIINFGADVILDNDTKAAIAAAIVQATINRINFEQGVGDDIAPSALNSIVLAIMPPQSINQITIQASKLGDPLGLGLVGITKRERARLLFTNITVNII